MKTSIVLATCDGAKFLPNQLASIVAQTSLPTELIASDDASTDETAHILDQFQREAPFKVIVIKNEHRLGYAKNFSQCAALASGDIVMFCDQDDVWHPEKISTLERFFANSRETLSVTHDISLIDESGNTIRASHFAFMRSNKRSMDKFIKGCATAMSSDLCAAAFPRSDRFKSSHDSWVHCIARIAGRDAYICEPLTAYRIHGSNTSGYLTPKGNIASRILDKMNNYSKKRMNEWVLPLFLLGPCDPTEMREAVRRGMKLREQNRDLKELIQTTSDLAHIQAVRGGLAQDASRLLWTSRMVGEYAKGRYGRLGGLMSLLNDIIRSPRRKRS